MRIDQPQDVAHAHSFTLGEWGVDPKACLVSRGDIAIKLRPQLIDVLVCLARRAGKVVLKDELLEQVWPGQYIAESGLSRCIAELRQILQDDAQQPRYIETVMKRGYRLIAPVAWLPAHDEATSDPGDAAAQVSKDATADGQPAGEPEAPAPRSAPASTAAGVGRARWLPSRSAAAAAVAVLLLVAGITTIVLMTRTRNSILTERDAVLLAFENGTNEKVFDETLPLAVSIQLEQSPYLALLSAERIQEALRMMKRPPDTALTRAVGLDVCERVGAQALIVTSTSRLGAQYVIGLEALACGTGTALARQQATTDRKEQVLDALQRAATRIRLALGESVASLERYNVPVVEATTASLDALRAVRRGDMAAEQGHLETALPLYREAVALDPNFALAYSRLGSIAFGVDMAVEFQTRAEQLAALRKAYELRQQVTFPERLEIEAAYHRDVTGEVARVVEALETLRRSYPQRALLRRDLAVEYMNSGRYAAAVAEALEAVRIEPNSPLNLDVAARAHLYLNQLEQARQTAEKSIAIGTGAAEPHILLFWCAVSADDKALLARERAWMSSHPELRPDWLWDLAEDSVSRGRLREAADALKELDVWVTAHGLSDLAARIRLASARYEALCGFGAQAMRRAEAELRHRPSPTAKVEAALVMVLAGRFDEAERLLDEMTRDGQPGASQPGATLALTCRAAIAASRGRAADALALLAPLEPYQLGWDFGFRPLFERGRAHYVGGDWAKARAAFETILAHPTIENGRKLQPHARIGLARTLARAGDIAGSRRMYEQFFDGWRDADPDLPVLLQARQEYAALPK